MFIHEHKYSPYLLMEILPIKIITTIGFLLVTVHPSTSLTCFKCTSRDHREGCATVDSTVLIQPCTSGEVCAKIVSYLKGYDDSKSARIYGVRVIRDCVPYDISLGPINECFNISSRGPIPTLRCLCNDTDLCNNSRQQVLVDVKQHVKLLFICFSLLLFINNIFIII